MSSGGTPGSIPQAHCRCRPRSRSDYRHGTRYAEASESPYAALAATLEADPDRRAGHRAALIFGAHKESVEVVIIGRGRSARSLASATSGNFSTMVRIWTERDAERYVVDLDKALGQGQPSESTCRALFEEFLAVSNLPPPEPRLTPYFQNGEVLRHLCQVLHIPQAKPLSELISRVARFGRDRNATFLRVRRLSGRGEYPNLELSSGRAHYVIRHGTPYLVTMNSAREESKYSYGSELSDWTRHETRLAAALSCTEFGRFTIYLTEYGRDLPLASIAHIEPEVRADFAIAYATMLAHSDGFDGRYYSRRDATTVVPEFDDFRPFYRLAKLFASRFLVSHPLLLRTTSHYLRATMLWRAEGHTEDALARLLFALEGCLLLMQGTHGGRTDRLDRRHLRAVFAQAYVGGEGLYDFIEEATGWGGTRARIVHPQLAVTEGWTPYLMADDYFEYASIVRALLMYVVTGETFHDYKLASIDESGAAATV